MDLRFATVPLLLVALGSTGLRAADAEVLFADDFATLRPGWGKASEKMTVEGNRLILNLQPNLIRDTLYGDRLFEDIDFRAKVAQIKGNTDQPGGLVFWATDHENFYLARFTADGLFSVGRRMHGRWLNPVLFPARDEVRQGLGQVNLLRVVTSGRWVTVYVNEKQVVRVNGFPPEGPSKIGVYAESGTDPATWAFSEMSVRQGPSPPEADGARDDTLLLTDDFSTLDPAWGTADEIESVSDDRLLVTLRPNLKYHNFYQGTLFENADIRMQVTQIAGGNDRPAGIVFWAANHKNYYAALLYADGTFSVARKLNDRWLNPVSAKVRDEVRPGLGQANQLRIVTSGKWATVYLNDKQVAVLRGFPPEGGSMIGLHAESGTEPYTWAFSALSVRKGPAPPDAPGPRDDALLFADDFSTLDPAWADAAGLLSVAGQALTISPRPNTAYNSLYSGTLFGDADIRVKVAQTGGRTIVTETGGRTVRTFMPAGLIFWAADYEHFYAALLRPDGGFFVARYEKDAKLQWKHLVPLKTWDAVQPGLGAVNEIRIVTKGNTGTAFVNNKEIGTFEGSPPEGGSKVGLRAQSGQDPFRWEFSELVVRKPQ